MPRTSSRIFYSSILFSFFFVSETVPIIDAQHRHYILLVAPPQTDEFKRCVDAAVNELKRERKNCSFTAEQQEHRRGRYPALSTGVYFGGGMEVSRASM